MLFRFISLSNFPQIGLRCLRWCRDVETQRSGRCCLRLDMQQAWNLKIEKFHRAAAHFQASRNSSQFFRNASHLDLPLLRAFGHANTWGQNILDQWEPEFSCDDESRVPEILGDGPKWLCGAEHHPVPCTLVSLGSNFDIRFERAMRGIAGCSAYIVDPTLASGGRKSRLAALSRELAALGAALNSSVGIGRNGATLKIMHENAATPLVGLRELLRDRYPGASRHVSILKVDVEGAEYDVLRDVYQMCADGELTVDAMTVEFHVGLAITSGDRERYKLWQLRDAFADAYKCGLMLHHKERNAWGCDGFVCVEFSWVSARHARRTLQRTATTASGSVGSSPFSNSLRSLR